MGVAVDGTMTAAAAHEGGIVPTTCSETTEHEDGPRALTLTLPQEPDSETDEVIPSVEAMNGLIDKETTAQPRSTSPASNDADAHTTDVGDCDSSGDEDSHSSSDSDGGSDGDGYNDDYEDDGSSYDTDEEDNGHSKKR
ncbi:hypothetical protein ARSEF4850_009418 [Beauveria asiatica]